MIQTLQRQLFAIAASLVVLDLAWALAGHFRIDTLAYVRLGLLSAALMGAGIFYQVRRGEPKIAAMFMGAAFLCAFSAAASVLNYFLLTVHGPRIDATLAAMDHALGFDWPSAVAAMIPHPLINAALFFAYNAVLPEIALVMVMLALTDQVERVYRFCLAVALGALLAIAIWTVFTACGTQALYTLSPQVAARVHLAVEGEYGAVLNRLLRGDPGYITPSELRGLIAFPSYHGMLALIVIWYGRNLRWAFWPLLVLNSLVLLATPIQGGHHLVDVLAAFPAAAFVLLLAGERVSAKSFAQRLGMVNKRPKFTITAIPQGLFRITPGQDDETAPTAIKSKLSGIS